MEKPHIEITVAEDTTKENQATNKEIQKPENPEIQEIYNKPNNSVNNANDANVLSSARDEIQNVSAAQPQNVSDSIYLSIRNKFMLKVFGILMFQLAFTFVVILSFADLPCLTRTCMCLFKLLLPASFDTFLILNINCFSNFFSGFSFGFSEVGS